MEESKKRFRHIIQKSHDDAIILSDPDDVIPAWMPGAAAVFGWREEEMLDKPISSIFTPDDRANGIPEQELSRARSNGEAPNVRWHATKGGGRVFLDGQTVALRNDDGSIRGFLKIGKDITEQIGRAHV